MPLLVDVMARLAANAPSLVSVEKAASLNAIQDIETQLPAAFVHYVSEFPVGTGSLSMGSVITQDRTRNIAVLVAAQGVSDDGLSEPLDTVRREIDAALVGYLWPGSNDGMVWVSGEVVAEEGVITWWRDTYSVHELRRHNTAS